MKLPSIDFDRILRPGLPPKPDDEQPAFSQNSFTATFKTSLTAWILTPLQRIERKACPNLSEMGSAVPTDIPNAGPFNRVRFHPNSANLIFGRGLLQWCVHGQCRAGSALLSFVRVRSPERPNIRDCDRSPLSAQFGFSVASLVCPVERGASPELG